MKKDISQPIVKDVYIAVIAKEHETGEYEWIAHIVNNGSEKLEGVLISTRGYGEIKGEHKKTATFRHSLDEIESKSFKKIETLPDELFALSNEFWVSFYINKKMFDKKYIFLTESISIFNAINVPLINEVGVMI
ncbi:MAG: hypothetical protein QMC21_06195 [Flavobacteriales bacterium]|jgi:hypothetical protein|tara:strand:- start:2604 stop:3005 length:402 start_codon:yes stop_codon:yes gene_type:complete